MASLDQCVHKSNGQTQRTLLESDDLVEHAGHALLTWQLMSVAESDFDERTCCVYALDQLLCKYTFKDSVYFILLVNWLRVNYTQIPGPEILYMIFY